MMKKKLRAVGSVRAGARRLKLLRAMRALSECIGWKLDDWLIATALREFGDHFSRDQVRADLAWFDHRRLVTIGEETVMSLQMTTRGFDAQKGNRSKIAPSLIERPELTSVGLKVLQALGRSIEWKSNELCVAMMLRKWGETISREALRADLGWLASRGFVTISEETLMTAHLTDSGIHVMCGTELMRGVAKAA